MGLGVKIPKNAFKQGREQLRDGGGFNDVELDPGKYVCIAKKLRFVDTKNGAAAVLDLKVAGESEQAGGRISIFYNLDEERIVWLFRALDRLGYDVSEVDEAVLEEVAADIEENTPVVRVTAKKNGDYINYYLDKLLKDVEAADVETEGAKEDAEEDAEEEEEKPAKKPAKKPAEEDKEDEEKKPAKKTSKKDAEEDDDAEEDPSGDEDEVELEVGMKVKSADGSWKGEAKVVAIDEAKGIIKVKTSKGVTLKVKPEDIVL